MNKNVLSVAAALVVSSSAGAALVSVEIIAGPANPGGFDTWMVVARFSDPADTISAVNGVVDPKGILNELDFFTGGGDMYNQEAFAGSPLNDFPSAGFPLFGEEYDSFVTIGATNFENDNTQFSPNFLGDWGDAPPTVQVILGSAFHESDGAWFFFGAPPEVGNLEDVEAGNDTYDVLIFQVGVISGVGFHLTANVQWFNPVSGDGNTPFTVDNIPAPGALALLGLAGLAGRRRRRR